MNTTLDSRDNTIGPPDSDHPSPETIARYLDRALGSNERSAVHDHLNECARCRDELVEARHALVWVRRRWIRRWGIPLAAAAALSILVPLVLREPEVLSDRLRAGTGQLQIRSVAPPESALIEGDSIRFVWSAGEARGSFVLTVTDSAGNRVLEARVQDTTFMAARQDLSPEPGAFLWFVDALFEDGRSAKSPVSRLRLR